MRCWCVKCRNNDEDGHCGLLKGLVAINENGECTNLRLKDDEEEAKE